MRALLLPNYSQLCARNFAAGLAGWLKFSSHTPLLAYVLLELSPKLLSQLGGLKWTRTTDLALIRRAL